MSEDGKNKRTGAAITESGVETPGEPGRGEAPDTQRVSVLTVDDDPAIIELVRLAAMSTGIAHSRGASSAAEAFGILSASRFDLVLLDLGLGDRSGPSLLSEVIAAAPGALVVVITADDRSGTIVDCMRRGSFDYIIKPVTATRIGTLLTHVLDRLKLQREVRMLRDRDTEAPRAPAFENVITRSPLMFALFRAAERIAPSPLAALIAGESGVGKELFAEAVHLLSGRSGSFVAVNVAGLDDTLFADTLFGHLRGAYTGAQGARRGLVREAEGGTLFLDEIGELGLEAQVKLLRFLQNGEYYALGADRPERSSARLVMATNADLKAKVAEGSFRADLYYRLMVHHITIPPRRERKEDIPLLVEHFGKEAAASLGRSAPRRVEAFAAAIADWDFPGNVRELFALVHSAFASADGSELPVSFARQYVEKQRSDRPAASVPEFRADTAAGPAEGGSAFLPLEEMITRHIAEALRRCGGNQSEAARLLGISQSTISRRLQGSVRQKE